MNQASFPDPRQLAVRIQQGERAAVASGLNLLDNALPQARVCAAQLLAALSTEQWLTSGHVIGVTGPPGAGKSSLLSALIREWRQAGKKVAVLAVDPSSRPESGGGALLGDRIRIKTSTADEGLFIRSLASRNQLGGVATEVWPMSWLLLSCFDIVVVETVGVGQTEIDIAEISDTVCYVAQPASGDTIQYLKSGIMEIPDVFAVNKSDLGGAAHKTAAEIGRSGSRPDRQEGWTYPVCLVSATHHTGIGKLTEHLEQHRNFLTQSGLLEKLRLKHQNGWVMRLLRDEFGSFGLQLAGGQAHLAERLKKNRINLFGEYQNAREQILARFTPATSFEKFIKKEATT
jgi:LAO/AO transport system kinase